jgi:8-oxo-dGTP diphosphatase
MDPRQVFRTYELRGELNVVDMAYCQHCGALLSRTMAAGRAHETCSNCGRKSYRNPAPAISVLVVNGERFLLARRYASAFQGGKWCLPCGYVEFSEDYLTAAIREVKEETGLDVQITALLSAVSNFFTPEIHTVVIVLLARPLGTDLTPGDDLDMVQWFRASEPLPEMAFEADSHIIHRYFETKLPGAPIDPRYGGSSNMPILS